MHRSAFIHLSMHQTIHRLSIVIFFFFSNINYPLWIIRCKGIYWSLLIKRNAWNQNSASKCFLLLFLICYSGQRCAFVQCNFIKKIRLMIGVITWVLFGRAKKKNCISMFCGGGGGGGKDFIYLKIQTFVQMINLKV